MRNIYKMKTHLATLFFCAFFAIDAIEAQYNCYNDYTPPVAICDGHTVVALGADGKATLYADVLDDGSYDNCGIAEFKVARMTPGWCPYGVVDDTQFRSFTQFCCEDIGAPIWVIFRVIDYAGNYNDCMVEVTVQDKLPPTIHCPYNVTISCDYWFNYNDLYNPNSTTFGYANAYDNCGLEQVYVNVIDNTSCGLGLIKRVFTAVDWGGATASCYQHVYITDPNPFGPYNIYWPSDYTADGCDYVDTDPHSLPPGYDRPTWNDNTCSLIGAAYDDLVFHFVDGVCKKILRTWTVIDWCQFDPYNPYYGGIWTHVQVIKLIDHDAPTFGDCTDQYVEGVESTCAGRLIHDPQIYDHCTPKEDLEFEYKVDIYANGSHDIVRTGHYIIDEVLPVGTHKVLWFVDDGCGNLGTCSYYVTVVDAKPPTPVCYAQLSSVVMPQGGMLTLWARDYDASSFDNCTAPEYLKFSFTPDYTQGSRTFTCDDIGTNTLQVYVTDAAGNQAYCNVFLQLDDNSSVCESMNVISGEVETYSGTPVAEAAVALYKVMPDASMEMDLLRMSDVEGIYQVGFGTTQFDRMIKVEKDGNPLEGISTLDMLYLQQHVMGIAPLTEDEARYAADVDGSGHLGVNDLIMLRDAFLSNGRSLQGQDLPWLFYPADCNWIDGQLDPACEQLVEIDHTAPPADAVNFKAVKKGDVNGDVLTQITTRSNGLDLGLLAKANATGSDLQVVALENAAVSGVQLSLLSQQFDEKTRIKAGSITLSAQNYYIDKQASSLNIAWVTPSVIQVNEGDVLFTVQFEYDMPQSPANIGLRGVYPNEMYTFERQAFPVNLRWITRPDADLTNAHVEDVPHEIGVKSEIIEETGTTIDEITVYPNPMHRLAQISFSAAGTAPGLFEVFATDLKQVVTQEINVIRGLNKIALASDQLEGPGVYYFRITSGDQIYTGKIVHVE